MVRYQQGTSMSWIKLRNDLRTHPKVVTLMSRMSVTMSHTIGLLSHCWMMADEHADENGRIKGTKDVVDVLVEMPGFADALESVGWLTSGEDESGPWLQFVNYQQHNGTTSKTRAAAQARKQQQRSRTTVTNVTHKRDTSVTREDKRREENISNTTASAVGVESDDSTHLACPVSEIIGYWNNTTGQKNRTTAKRTKAARARWKDEHFREHWEEAVRRVAASRFCMGQNDRNWLASIDWFLRPDTVTKIMEGTYDDRFAGRQFRGSADNASKAQQRDQRLARAISESVAEDDEGGVRGNGRDSLRIETARGIDETSNARVVQAAVTVRREDDSGGDSEDGLPF